jgi:hypothetical protein
MALLPHLNPDLPEIQKLFESANEEQVSPYNWIPPKWDVVKTAGLNLRDTSPDRNGFKPLSDDPSPAAGTKKFVDACEAKNPEPHPGNDPDPRQWVHQGSDFRHIDPTEFADADIDALKKDIEKLGSAAVGKKAFDNLNTIVGPQSRGMKRLARVFEWTLWRATVLLDDINKALDDKELAAFRNTTAPKPKNQEEKYDKAREHYLAFLRDLDDHEPETKSKPSIDLKDPKLRSGYGRTIKWVCIDPVIVQGRIQEAEGDREMEPAHQFIRSSNSTLMNPPDHVHHWLDPDAGGVPPPVRAAFAGAGTNSRIRIQHQPHRPGCLRAAVEHHLRSHPGVSQATR